MSTKDGSGSLTRRRFLAGVGGVIVVAAGARSGIGLGCADDDAGVTINVAEKGAVGDGVNDDAEAFRAALAAVPEGGTVLCKQGGRHLINSGVLEILRDGVTLDLNRATLIAGPRLRGSGLPGLLIHVKRCREVRVTNGRIEDRRLTRSDIRVTIVLSGCRGCRIDRLNPSYGGRGRFLWILGGSHHAVEENVVSRGDFSGSACSDVVIARNTFREPVENGISLVGFRDLSELVASGAIDPVIARHIEAGAAGEPTDASRNSIIDNVVLGYGRNAIEDYAFGEIDVCVGNTIRGNRIARPAPGGGFAISEVGNDGVVEGNVIEEPAAFAAIEASAYGTRVSRNVITRRIPDADVGGIVVVGKAFPDAPDSRALIDENDLRLLGKGISVYGMDYPAPRIEDNLIVDPIRVGIDLAPGPAGSVCERNEIRCIRPPLGGARSAIRTVSEARIRDNRVLYDRSSASGFLDIPLELIGDGVEIIGNVVNGGGRTDGLVVSKATGAARELVWLDNRHTDGASVETASLSFAKRG